MKRYMKTAVCSVLVFLAVVGSAIGFIGSLYNADSATAETVVFSDVISGTEVDSGTVALPLPDDIVVDSNTDFDIVFDDISYPSKYLSSMEIFIIIYQQLTPPDSPVQQPVQPVVPPEEEDTENDKPNNNTVQRPNNNTISNLAGVIKGRDYGSGISIYQGNGSGISTDTDALLKAIDKGSSECSFIAIRLSDGASIAYNVREKYRCASTYKALTTLYIYKMAEAGVLSLDETMTYTRSDYYSGSGIIKSYSTGTKFTLRQLADYSVRYSDNIAFVMLQRYINDNDLVDFAKSLGCENYTDFQMTWPNITALDAALWWAEIYKFAKTSDYGNQFYNIFLNATHTIIKDALGKEHPVAHKSGSISHYYHDCGIVESEDPYLIIVLSHNPRSSSSKNPSYVNPIIQEIDKIMNP